MAMKTMDDLFVHFLRDMFYAERKGAKEMGGMIRKASAPELKDLLTQHREETEQQLEMLREVFEKLGMRPRAVTCEAINGIAEEAHEIMEEAQDERTRDCGIVAAAQAVEHYEISRYGTMVSWARALGHEEVAGMLGQILEQEKLADRKLTELAERTLNAQAQGVGGDAGMAAAGDVEEDEAPQIKKKTGGRGRKAA